MLGRGIGQEGRWTPKKNMGLIPTSCICLPLLSITFVGGEEKGPSSILAFVARGVDSSAGPRSKPKNPPWVVVLIQYRFGKGIPIVERAGERTGKGDLGYV